MTQEQAFKIANAVQQLGKDCEVRTDYSARGAYGKHTVAILTDCDPVTLGWVLCDLGFSIHDIPKGRDSMGRDDRVYY